MNQFAKTYGRFSLTLMKIIEVVFGIWMTTILIGTIQHPHFTISTVSNRLIAVLILCIVLAAVTRQRILRQALTKIFASQWFLIFIIAVVIAYQAMFSIKLSTPIGFEPAWLYSLLASPKKIR